MQFIKKHHKFIKKCKIYVYIMLSAIIINNISNVIISYKKLNDISLSKFNEEIDKYVSMAAKTGEKIVTYKLQCEDIPSFLKDEKKTNSIITNTEILGISWKNKNTSCYSNSLVFKREESQKSKFLKNKTIVSFVEEDIFKIKVFSIRQNIFDKNNSFIGVLKYKISAESFSKKIKQLNNINNSFIELFFDIDSNNHVSFNKKISMTKLTNKIILDICKFLLIPLISFVLIYLILYKDFNLETDELKSINKKIKEKQKNKNLILQSIKQQQIIEKKILQNIFFSLSDIIKKVENILIEENLHYEKKSFKLEEIYEILTNIVYIKTNDMNENNFSNINDIIKIACEINHEKSLSKQVSLYITNNKDLVVNKNYLRLIQIFSGIISYILDTSANDSLIEIKVSQESSKVKVFFEEKNSFVLGINKQLCNDLKNDFCKLSQPSWETTKKILEIEKIDIITGFCHSKKGKYIYLSIENKLNEQSEVINVIQFPK